MRKLAFIFAAASVLAVATPAMALDFTQKITQLDGTDLKGPDGKPTELTLATVAETALNSSFEDERNLDGAEKVKRFLLSEKIEKGQKDVTVSADDIALIKKVVAKAYNPLIVGQAWRMLDPNGMPH